MNQVSLPIRLGMLLAMPVVVWSSQQASAQLPDPYNPNWADGFNPGTYDYQGDYVDKWVEPMEPEMEEWEDIYHNYTELGAPYSDPDWVPPVGPLGSDAADTGDRFLPDPWDYDVYNYNDWDYDPYPDPNLSRPYPGLAPSPTPTARYNRPYYPEPSYATPGIPVDGPDTYFDDEVSYYDDDLWGYPNEYTYDYYTDDWWDPDGDFNRWY